MPILSESQQHYWQQHGRLLLSDVLPPEITRDLPLWINDMTVQAEGDEQRLHYYEHTSHGKVLCRIERFLDDHSALRGVILEGSIPVIVSELMGEEARLYKEKINYKSPGGAGYAPHQDAAAYPFVHRHITCLIAIDEMALENGCLEFAPSHGEKLLPLDDTGCMAAEVVDALPWQPLPVPAGGVFFFSSHAPHRSGTNRSSTPRRALYLTYHAASEGALRAYYYAERDRQLAAHDRTGTTARISTIGHFLGQRAQ